MLLLRSAAAQFPFFVFHTSKLHTLLSFSSKSKKLNQPGHTGTGVRGHICTVTQGPLHLHSETFSYSQLKHFLNLFLLVSQCYKNASTSIACSRENRPAVPQLEVCKQSTYIHSTKRGVT